MTTAERFWAKTERMDSGCIVWMGARNKRGYGLFHDGASKLAHRVVMRLTGFYDGPLPLDHLCRNHSCVNPYHLDPVTQKVNSERGETGQHNRTKTHCPQGHEYAGKNLYIHADGRRFCRACIREKKRIRDTKTRGTGVALCR